MGTFGSGSASWDRINDGIDSGTPDDTNGVVGLDGDRWRGTFTSPSFSGSCTNIIVRFRAKNDDGSDGVKVTLYSNGTASDGQSGNFFPSSSYSDFEENYTLSKTAANLTSLEVRIDSFSGSFDDWISEIEVEIVLPSSSSSSSSSTST